MKHMYKVILAMALSLMLALPVFALADGDVPEEENRIEEQVENQEEAQYEAQDEDVETEADEADFVNVMFEETPVEFETDLPGLDWDALDEEDADEEDTNEKDTDEETSNEAESKEEAVEEEPVEDESAEEPIEEKSDGEPAEKESDEEESAEDESAEETVEEESDGESAEDEPAQEQPSANDLTYTGEAQTLVSVVSGEDWMYSLDGESYSAETPTAVDAGEYTVYCVFADDAEVEPVALTVTIAKADVVLTPPVANVF